MSDYYCASCGTFGRVRTITKGSFGIELLLWLCCVFPGVLYSIWRLTTRYRGCHACGAPVIPSDTPGGYGGTAAAIVFRCLFNKPWGTKNTGTVVRPARRLAHAKAATLVF